MYKTFLVSLLLSIFLTLASVNYQVEKRGECLQVRPGCNESFFSAGFPLQFIPRSDISSPANIANFNDTFNGVLLFANVLFYLLILLPTVSIIKKILGKRVDPSDELTVTYFVHGTTIDNESGLATGWLPGELSALGVQQSKQLGSRIAGQKYDVVFTSDLKRAIDSVKFMFGNTHPVVVDERLREVNYGDYNGMPEDFKNNLNQYIKKSFPNGESYGDVEKRIRDFLKEVRIKYRGKRIAVVGHQAPQLALEVITKNKTWEEAIVEDWRRAKKWQPGWDYTVR